MATSLANLGAVAAQIALGTIVVKPVRKFASFTAQVTLREVHHDDLTITNHPVEQGAQISDHAFKNPAHLILEMSWSNSPSVTSFLGGIAAGLLATGGGVQALFTGNSANQVRDVYDRLLKLQTSRTPFSVYTGKRVYQDMLIKALSVTTDKDTENSLRVTAELQQVIMVSTKTVQVSAPVERQADPGVTQPISNVGQQNLIPNTSYVPR